VAGDRFIILNFQEKAGMAAPQNSKNAHTQKILLHHTTFVKRVNAMTTQSQNAP
jgi:hypothetical protein